MLFKDGIELDICYSSENVPNFKDDRASSAVKRVIRLLRNRKDL